MEKFLLLFYGGKMETDPKKAEKSMAVWLKWFADLGKAVVDPGAPTMPGKTVSSSGVKSGVDGPPVTGYTILQSANLDEAVKLAKSCPIIANEGKIVVYSLMPMPT